MTVSIEKELGGIFCIAKQHPTPSGENSVPLCLKDDKKKDVYPDGGVSYGTIDFGRPDCKDGYDTVGYVPAQKVEQFKSAGAKQFANDRLVTSIPFLCGDEDATESAVPLHEAGLPLFLSSIGSSSSAYEFRIDRRILFGGAIVTGLVGGALYHFGLSTATGAVVAVAGVSGGLLLVIAFMMLVLSLGGDSCQRVSEYAADGF